MLHFTWKMTQKNFPINLYQLLHAKDLTFAWMTKQALQKDIKF